MKWAKARKHRRDCYAWQDLLHVMLVTLVLAIVAAIVIFLLLVIMNPRVVTAGDITNFRTAIRQVPVTLHSDKVTTRESVTVVTILCEVSAYNATIEQTDGNPLRTASGKRVYVGGIAADLDVLPFGSIVLIPGYNDGKPCQVVDTGSAIQGNKLDVFLWSEADARQWGRRKNVSVEVLYVPRAK